MISIIDFLVWFENDAKDYSTYKLNELIIFEVEEINWNKKEYSESFRKEKCVDGKKIITNAEIILNVQMKTKLKTGQMLNLDSLIGFKFKLNNRKWN